MKSAVYDAGALIAAERNHRRFWAEHRARLEMDFDLGVPAAVVAQVSRSARQVQLRRLLRACEVVPLDEQRAHEVGVLLGRSRTTDIPDAALVTLALARKADIVTSHQSDIERLLAATHTRTELRVVRP